MWRDADTEARDLKSNALIARQCAIDVLVLERSWQRCSESVGFSAPRLARPRRDAPTASTRSSRYDSRRIRSTQKMRSSFVGDHIGAASELRTDVVKAEARRVERSEMGVGGVRRGTDPEIILAVKQRPAGRLGEVDSSAYACLTPGSEICTTTT